MGSPAMPSGGCTPIHTLPNCTPPSKKSSLKVLIPVPVSDFHCCSIFVRLANSSATLLADAPIPLLVRFLLYPFPASTHLQPLPALQSLLHFRVSLRSRSLPLFSACNKLKETPARLAKQRCPLPHSPVEIRRESRLAFRAAGGFCRSEIHWLRRLVRRFTRSGTR